MHLDSAHYRRGHARTLSRSYLGETPEYEFEPDWEDVYGEAHYVPAVVRERFDGPVDLLDHLRENHHEIMVAGAQARAQRLADELELDTENAGDSGE